MKIAILLTLVILIAGSFKPNTNVLVGKWELFYLKTMSGGITKKGNDIPDTILFSEQTLKHGKSLMMDFNKDGSTIITDYRTDTTGTTIKTKYKLIKADQVCIYNDTLFYNVTRDTLTLQIMRYRNYYNHGEPFSSFKYLRQK